MSLSIRQNPMHLSLFSAFCGWLYSAVKIHDTIALI